jgi:uncharacterized protein (DUF1697 family)
MKDLRQIYDSLEDAGYRAVIQSGNVLFESDAPRASLEHDLEAMLERRLEVSRSSSWCGHTANSARWSRKLRTVSARRMAHIIPTSSS